MVLKDPNSHSRNIKSNVHTHSNKPFWWCNGKPVEDSRSIPDPVRPKTMKLVCCYIR